MFPLWWGDTDPAGMLLTKDNVIDVVHGIV